MKCVHCGKSPTDDPAIALIRQNPKGETGVWACTHCLDKSSDTYPMPVHGWRCFHCGDHFPGTDEGLNDAREHFGPDPAWTPICVERMQLDTTEILTRMRSAELTAQHAIEACRHAEEIAEGINGAIAELARRFKDPRITSTTDIWNEYDAMKGRATTAEAVLKHLQDVVPEQLLAARVAIAGPGTYYPYV